MKIFAALAVIFAPAYLVSVAEGGESVSVAEGGESVGWVERSEPHRQDLVGLASLDPPYETTLCFRNRDYFVPLSSPNVRDALARLAGSIVLGIIIGLLMAAIFCRSERKRTAATMAMHDPPALMLATLAAAATIPAGIPAARAR